MVARRQTQGSQTFRSALNTQAAPVDSRCAAKRSPCVRRAGSPPTVRRASPRRDNESVVMCASLAHENDRRPPAGSAQSEAVTEVALPFGVVSFLPKISFMYLGS